MAKNQPCAGHLQKSPWALSWLLASFLEGSGVSPLTAEKWGRDRLARSPRQPGFWAPGSWTLGSCRFWVSSRAAAGKFRSHLHGFVPASTFLRMGSLLPHPSLSLMTFNSVPLHRPPWNGLGCSKTIPGLWALQSLTCHLFSPAL